MTNKPDRKFRLFRFAVRSAAAVGVFGVVAVLAGKALAPGGTMTAKTDLIAPAPFVSLPLPSDRVGPPERAVSSGVSAKEEAVPVLGDPVYLDLTPPAAFDRVDVAVNYENDGQPEVLIGALASTLDNQFDLRPAENRLLDSLGWNVVTSGRLALYQRDRRYVSVDEFLADPPDFSSVAVYGAATPTKYVLPDYRPTAGIREIEANLRGSERLLTYVKKETLNFQFTVQDMNRLDGPDPVVVSVYRQPVGCPDGAEEQPVARAVLADDGNVSTDQKSSGLRRISVAAAGLEEGVYRVEVTTTDDVFIRKFSTGQSRFVFAGRLYLGDIVGYSDRHRSVTVYADGTRLTAMTSHAEAQQTIQVGGRPLAISEPQVRCAQDLAGGRVTPVTSPAGDVLLETDGVFALSQDEFFDPLPYSLSWLSRTADLDARGIRYILADYDPPAETGPIRTVQAEFETARLARTADGAYRFAISAPGLGSVPGRLLIKSVVFRLRRDRVSWAEAWDRFVNRRRGGDELLILPQGKSFGENPD